MSIFEQFAVAMQIVEFSKYLNLLLSPVRDGISVENKKSTRNLSPVGTIY